MTSNYKKGYARGYYTGSLKAWPDHRPPLPPEERIAHLIVAATALRDAYDIICATFDEGDEIVDQLAPKVDAFDAAMSALGKWVRAAAPSSECNRCHCVEKAQQALGDPRDCCSRTAD